MLALAEESFHRDDISKPSHSGAALLKGGVTCLSILGGLPRTVSSAFRKRETG